LRAAFYELHSTIDFREQSVVFTTTYIVARVHFSAALTNDDASCRNDLTTKAFYT
jgi:hypothetical protein